MTSYLTHAKAVADRDGIGTSALLPVSTPRPGRLSGHALGRRDKDPASARLAVEPGAATGRPDDADRICHGLARTLVDGAASGLRFRVRSEPVSAGDGRRTREACAADKSQRQGSERLERLRCIEPRPSNFACTS
jgi:hypothetical protein